MCCFSLPATCAVRFTAFLPRICPFQSLYKVDIAVEPGSTHHYVFEILTSPGAPELVSRPPRGSSCDFDGEANYGFVAPSTCGGVLSLPAYEWQNGCACAGC